MKKVLFLALLSLIFVSCSQQSKVERKVEKYVKSILDDDKSYESVDFGEIDTLWLSFDESAKWHDLYQSYSDAEFKHKFWVDLLTDPQSKEIYPNVVFQDSIDFYLKEFNEIKPVYEKALKSYVPEIEGFYIEHKFRANNKLGVKVLDNIVIYFDKDFEITGTNK